MCGTSTDFVSVNIFHNIIHLVLDLPHRMFKERQGYIFWPFPIFLSKLKKMKNMKEDLKTGREKGEKEEK